MANQLLFDGRFRAGHLLDIGRHVERPDSIQRERVFLAPVKELVTGPCISHPGIPVPDGGREEFNIGIGSPGADITPPLSDSSSHGESRSLGHITASFSAGFESVRDASLTERATLRRKIVLRSPG
jgi:hypothetical protein